MSDRPKGPPLGPELEEPELALLDPATEAALAEALRAAFAPSEIDPRVHESMLEAALEDPFAPPSEAELVESERLRRALDGEGEHSDLALARALQAAHAPKAAPRTSLTRAVALKPRQPKLIYLRFGAALATVAAAAMVLLSLRAVHRPARAVAPVAGDLQTLALAQSRSTAPLFANAASAGAPSTRIDRIASLREHELRENRYALWGVR